MLAGMFLRRKTKSARGVGYSYWHLCETVRTARGPRRRVVASLGKLDQAEPAGWRGGWDDLGSLLRGETPRAKTADLTGLAPSASTEPSAQWERADISGLRVERTRDFGESYLALSLWHRLKLSLHDIEACLRAQRGLAYHLGFRATITRSGLARANEQRDWRPWALLARKLMAKVRALY